MLSSDMPQPSSRTVTSSSPASSRAVTLIVPPDSAKPWIIEFSTMGWSISFGTSTSSAASSTSVVSVNFPGKRMLCIST